MPHIGELKKSYLREVFKYDMTRFYLFVYWLYIVAIQMLGFKASEDELEDFELNE